MTENSRLTLFSSDKNYWETPQALFDQLDAEFGFTLDAAASDTNHKCARFFTAQQNGLHQDWGGQCVFVNPPYGNVETGEWTRKCWLEAQKPNTTVVLLIPARTDRRSFHQYIYDASTYQARPGVSIRFLPGRLKFELDGAPVGTAPFPSMVVVFRDVPRAES